MLANSLAGAIAAMVGSLFIWLTGGFGVLLSGAIIGLILGLGQALILFTADESEIRKQWILYSAIGGFLGIFPAFVLSFVSLFNIWIGMFLIGASFAGLLGLLQSFVLVKLLGDYAYLWIGACLLAGAVSALFSVPILQSRIPLLCSPTLPLFALLTGRLIFSWMTQHEGENDNDS